MNQTLRYALGASAVVVLVVGPAVDARAASGAFGSSTTRVSVKSNETQVFAPSSQSETSLDGRFIAFVSGAQGLVTGDTNGKPDVFLRDRVAGTTIRVSVGSGGGQGNGRSDLPSLSRDGRYVAFFSQATNLVSGDTNGKSDIFVRDVVAGSTRRLSIPAGGGQANGDSAFPSISDDGQQVAFGSAASNLVSGDGNGQQDIFVRDLAAGTTRRLSVSSTGIGGNGPSIFPRISGNGDVVAFVSDATNLVPGDTNGSRDVVVRVRSTNTTQLVSVGAGGEPADSVSADPALSSDGRYVAFDSSATNLLPGDTNGFQDVFVRDRVAGTTQLVSVWPSGTPTNRLSTAPDISENGQIVVFVSQFSDAGALSNVYRRNRGAGITQLASVGLSGQPADSNSFGASVSPDGQHVGFTSTATNLVAGDTNNQQDVFVRD
jgi:Tol biopolymer transport system component